MSEQLFRQIARMARTYGRSLAHDPMMRVEFVAEPSIVGVDFGGWHLRVVLLCFGEIVDDVPEPLGSVLWEARREALEQCLEDVLEQIHTSCGAVGHAPTDGRIVRVSAALRPAR